MPYPEILDPVDQHTEVLDTDTSLRLLARCAMDERIYSERTTKEDLLEDKLTAANKFLALPLDELVERQQQFITDNMPAPLEMPDISRTVKLSIDSALALCLKSITSSKSMRRNNAIYNALQRYNYILPVTVDRIDQLIEWADFEPYSKCLGAYPRPTQAIVLTNKVLGTVVRSKQIPGGDRVWKAYVDVGKENADGSPAFQQIMYGYDGNSEKYTGLSERSLVVVALPGARLLRPNGETAKLRPRHWNFTSSDGTKHRVDSKGMLCSVREACNKPQRHYVESRGWMQTTVLTLPYDLKIRAGTPIGTIIEDTHSDLVMVTEPWMGDREQVLRFKIPPNEKFGIAR